MSGGEPQFRTAHPATQVGKQRKSRIIPIAVTIGCGVFLALGSCFGFVATLDVNGGHNKVLNTLSGWGMVAGVLLFVFGVIWAVVVLIVQIFRAIRGSS